MDETTITKKPLCFVVMPISDQIDYGSGHFTRVYEHLIKPACEEAGYEVRRADEDLATNSIFDKIIESLIDADLVVCDVSSKNPNVFFELGIRISFQLPVVLLHDDLTGYTFDVSHIRHFKYDHSLRIDHVNTSKNEIVKVIKTTMADFKRDPKSYGLLGSLKKNAAQIEKFTEKKEEDKFTDIFLKLNSIESNFQTLKQNTSASTIPSKLINGWKAIPEKIELRILGQKRTQIIMRFLQKEGTDIFGKTNENATSKYKITNNRSRTLRINEIQIPPNAVFEIIKILVN